MSTLDKIGGFLLVAWGSLLHHIAVAREALRAEKEGLRTPGRSRDESAFLPAVLEVRECPPSPIGRGLLLVIAAVFTISVIWAVVGEVDIIATAQGKVIPSGKVKTIQPLETGVVLDIQVQDGQRVKAGDVLIKLDPTGAEADQERLIKERDTAKITVVRLSALLEPDPLKAFDPPQDLPAELASLHRHHLNSELAERAARRATLLSEITRLSRSLPNLHDQVESKRKLLGSGYTARLPFLELENQLIEAEAQLDTAKAKLAQLDAEDQRGVLDRLTEARQQRDSLEQDLIKAQTRNRLQTLTAPVDGVVQQLAVHTVGGVVTPAQELLTIVPDDHSIEIEAMVENKDIGFVKDGQPAEVKVEAFPFTKYGTLPGSVLTVSRDAVLQENQGWLYPARFSLAQTEILADEKYIPLTSGMAVTVEIKTGKRQLIQYLLAPLQEYQDESLRER